MVAIKSYIRLLRLDKPIGILLLLWPTMWALWLANHGMPSLRLLFVFVLGTVLMRSCGCVLNDIADRKVDGFVERTKSRPLAQGEISVFSACVVAGVLAFISFLLVLLCNALTIGLAVVGAVLALGYPYLKRVTHLPQLGLGVAFAWGIPMAFAASTGFVSEEAWFLFLTAAIWPVIYDTMYAMVDREDDVRLGVKSTAILFGRDDRLMIGLLQCVFIVMLSVVGKIFQLDVAYQYCLLSAIILFLYQQILIKDRERSNCFAAFLNNQYVGMAVFIGILWGQV